MRSHLEIRRIAAHVLNMLVREFNLGQKAWSFQGDQFSDWDVRSDWEVWALKEGRKVAEIAILTDPERAYVVIPDWFDMCRGEHLSEFVPPEQDTRETVEGDPYPDGVYEIEFHDIENLNAPELALERYVAGRRPRVICSR